MRLVLTLLLRERLKSRHNICCFQKLDQVPIGSNLGILVPDEEHDRDARLTQRLIGGRLPVATSNPDQGRGRPRVVKILV